LSFEYYSADLPAEFGERSGMKEKENDSCWGTGKDRGLGLWREEKGKGRKEGVSE